jgi:hypothetical protein
MSETPIPSDPVFRVSTGTKVLLGVFMAPLILFLTGGSVWFVLYGAVKGGAATVLLLSGLGFASIFGSFVWSMFLTKVEILPNAMRFTRGFRGVQEVPFDNIAGYRERRAQSKIATMSPVIVLLEPPNKGIMIAHQLERSAELERFIKSRFTNLDKADRDADMKAALSDAQLGSTTEERRATLSRALIHGYILYGAATFSLLWAFIYPHPYAAVVGLLAVLPVAAVAFSMFSHGAITLYGKTNSVRPGVAFVVLAPCLALALREFKDWHIIAWSGFWLPFGVMGVLLIGILCLGSISDSHRNVLGFLGLSVVFLAQAFGLVLFANCYPDRSVPEMHRTTVVSRRIQSGKSRTYYLYVSPWLDGTYSKQIAVSGAFYEEHSDGSTVLIGVRPGVLRIPWFFVD